MFTMRMGSTAGILQQETSLSGRQEVQPSHSQVNEVMDYKVLYISTCSLIPRLLCMEPGNETRGPAGETLVEVWYEDLYHCLVPRPCPLHLHSPLFCFSENEMWGAWKEASL